MPELLNIVYTFKVCMPIKVVRLHMAKNQITAVVSEIKSAGKKEANTFSGKKTWARAIC